MPAYVHNDRLYVFARLVSRVHNKDPQGDAVGHCDPLTKDISMKKSTSILAIAALLFAGSLAAQSASAAVSISRAEVTGTNLRIEGSALASRSITVDGVVMGTSGSDGRFRIERDPYTRPADCTVDVNDGTATPRVATLSGCTVTTPPPSGTDTTAPTVPGSLTATRAGSAANLNWIASTDNVGVIGYRITRNGSVLSGTFTDTTFSDQALGAGTYTYTVRAVDAADNVSASSNSASVTVPAAGQTTPADTTAPTVPENFNAVLRGRDNVDMTWTVSTDNVAVAGYQITRNGTLRGTTINNFSNETFLPDGTYTYSVAAFDAAGNVSASTNSITLTVQPVPETDTTAPSAPGLVTTTVIGSNINVGWGLSYDDTAVTGYKVTRNGAFRITVNSDQFNDSGLAPGSYTYSVVAFDAAGNTSTSSASTTATVSAPEGLAFITPPQLPDARVGDPYLAYIVSTDPPGPSTFRFRLVSGSIPNGTQLLKNTLENRPEARVSGTPTRAGTYSFTVEVRDNTGTTARRTFTIRVL